jgi:hypothetical protein
MNKILVGISIGLLLGLIAYYSLTFFSPNEFISKDFARVTIKNESGINAKRILLQHRRGSIEAMGLRDKEEMRFVFRNGNAENSYKILVTFDNDKTVTSKEVYFEYGYRGTETINALVITTENNW